MTTSHDAAGDPLQAAIAHHRRGELDAAQVLYAELLQADPRRADVLNFMGMLMVQRGEPGRALELLKKASMIAPREPGVWNNLGNALLGLGRLPEAEKAFHRSLALAESAEPLTNLARIQRRRQEWARSEASARRAVALAPQSGEAWHYLSLALLGLQRPEEAFEAAVQAELLLPAHVNRREAYGRALWAAGQHERAVAFYRDWLDKEPGNPYAQHHLAAALGQTPERASDAYVEKVFDQFAASFDTQLATLKYCAPELVAEAVAAVLPPPAAQFDVADLGCGTGLCGPLLKPWARSLVGCDLSANMLERAAPRRVYDELRKAELVRFLAERPAAFDVLVSADTLIYIGELAPMFVAAHAALRPGGALVFTLEALDEADGADFRLAESGRYAHALPGLRARLAAAGFAAPTIASITPRMESARAVAGWLVTVRRG
ncbi:MAG: tetratricopeptide repeat protein [Burkholderiales bacterium]|nr:tetratricopeptide repeat protein [Burkholderiales bacterium]